MIIIFTGFTTMFFLEKRYNFLNFNFYTCVMMNLLNFLLIFTMFFTISGHTQTVSEPNFPDDFFGIYKGTLNIASSRGPSTYPMEFHLLPTDSIGKYHYILIYGDGDMRQERKYTLLTKDAAKGEYVVDENNGIVLDDKVIGNRMYSLFEVQGTILTTFITFEENHMDFEIVATQRENSKTTFAENEEKTEVISYPVSTIQRAVLIKQ